MGLQAMQSEFLKNVALLILKAREMGYEVTGGELYRTNEQALINTGDWKLINKSTGEEYGPLEKKGVRNSLHLERLAIDLNLFMDGRYLGSSEHHQFLGDFWETLHPLNRWGGRFKDGNHYEMTKEAWR